jgi:hypothetical protein
MGNIGRYTTSICKYDYVSDNRDGPNGNSVGLKKFQ